MLMKSSWWGEQTKNSAAPSTWRSPSGFLAKICLCYDSILYLTFSFVNHLDTLQIKSDKNIQKLRKTDQANDLTDTAKVNSLTVCLNYMLLAAETQTVLELQDFFSHISWVCFLLFNLAAQSVWFRFPRSFQPIHSSTKSRTRKVSMIVATWYTVT